MAVNFLFKRYRPIAGILICLHISIAVFAQYDSITIDDDYRYFQIHLPPSYNEEKVYPLIIALHGGFGSGSQLENQSRLSEKADEEEFILVYPDGVRNFVGIRTWNSGVCCGSAVNNDIDDVGFIRALLDSLNNSYSIDQARVYATGMSNGGFMSYRLACELSDQIAAIAPVACSMNFDCIPETPVPIIHFHSYLDESIPYLGGVGNGVSDHYNPPLDSVFGVWRNFNTCISQIDTLHDDEDYLHIGIQDCECDADMELYLMHDGGHSWPGGRRGSIFGDPPSQIISANDLMWEFFQKHMVCDDRTTSVTTEKSNPEVQMFPNPVTKSLYLKGKTEEEEIAILSLDGRMYKVKPVGYVGSISTINVQFLPKGIYFIISKNEAFPAMKFIKL